MFGHHGHHYGRRGRGAGCGAPGGWGNPFGVRRPLRFLAYRLELDDDQVAELAKILKHLKNERAQAKVDKEKSIEGIADAFGSDAFDEKAAQAALDLRVEAAQRLNAEIVAALKAIHALLDEEQRQQLGYLLRTGGLTI